MVCSGGGRGEKREIASLTAAHEIGVTEEKESSLEEKRGKKYCSSLLAIHLAH